MMMEVMCDTTEDDGTIAVLLMVAALETGEQQYSQQWLGADGHPSVFYPLDPFELPVFRLTLCGR